MFKVIQGAFLQQIMSSIPCTNKIYKFTDNKYFQIAMASSSASSIESIQKNLISASVRLLKKFTREDLKMGNVFIYAAKFLNDGRLLASDTNKRRLLMFNSYFGLIKQLPVAGEPLGLCTGADSTTVHVVCDHNKIVTYTLQGEEQKTSQFKTEQNTCGLDRSGDILICGTRSHVVLYNKDGQELSSIQQQEGGCNTTICTSTNGTMFYHTNADQLVGRILQDSKEIFRYSHPSLKYAYGPSCDIDGNILVAGVYSHNIHHVSPDGQNGRILLDKLSSIYRPCCVCCHPHRDVFVVTSWDEDTVMEIYEFC